MESSKQCLSAQPRIRRQAYSSSKQTDQPAPEEAEPKGPTQDTLPDVSHEAAAMDKILSGKKCDGAAPGSPELEQGTPIDEVGLLISPPPQRSFNCFFARVYTLTNICFERF